MHPKHSYLIDDTIQVRFGIKDADFPMITIGGWVGKITEVDLHHPVSYLIRWSQETLSLMHPVFKNLCERDGLEIGEMWLDQDSIEPFKFGSTRKGN